MLTKVDLFAPPDSRYKVLQYFTEMLMTSLIKNGVRVRLFDSSNTKDPRKFLAMMLTDRPDCTLSINGLLPDESGKSLADTLNIPHFAYLVRTPQNFLQMLKSHYNIYGCIDQFHTLFLQMFGGTHALFLPLAADGSITYDKKGKRPYDVALFGTYVDPESIKSRWCERYTSDFCRAIEEASVRVLKEPSLSLIQALSDSLKTPIEQGKVDPYAINFAKAFTDLEDYVKAVSKTEMINAVQGVKVHLFGEGWEQFEPKGDVEIHAPILYAEVVEKMKETKIVLNSAPNLKLGGHENFYSATMAGALPISGLYPYQISQYPSKQAAIYTSGPEELNEQVHNYLDHPGERNEIVDNARGITLKKNTWDHRVKELMTKLPPILEKFPVSEAN